MRGGMAISKELEYFFSNLSKNNIYATTALHFMSATFKYNLLDEMKII